MMISELLKLLSDLTAYKHYLKEAEQEQLFQIALRVMADNFDQWKAEQ